MHCSGCNRSIGGISIHSIGCDVQTSEKDAGDQLGVPKRIFGGEANSRGERRPSTWPSWSGEHLLPSGPVRGPVHGLAERGGGEQQGRGGRGYPVVGQAEKAGRRPKVLRAAVSDAVRLSCISLIDVQWRNRRSNGPIKGPEILLV